MEDQSGRLFKRAACEFETGGELEIAEGFRIVNQHWQMGGNGFAGFLRKYGAAGHGLRFGGERGEGGRHFVQNDPPFSGFAAPRDKAGKIGGRLVQSEVAEI